MSDPYPSLESNFVLHDSLIYVPVEKEQEPRAEIVGCWEIVWPKADGPGYARSWQKEDT